MDFYRHLKGQLLSNTFTRDKHAHKIVLDHSGYRCIMYHGNLLKSQLSNKIKTILKVKIYVFYYKIIRIRRSKGPIHQSLSRVTQNKPLFYTILNRGVLSLMYMYMLDIYLHANEKCLRTNKNRRPLSVDG